MDKAEKIADLIKSGKSFAQAVQLSAGEAALPKSTIHYGLSEGAMSATHKAAKSGSPSDHTNAAKAHATAHDAHVKMKYGGDAFDNKHHTTMANFHQEMAIHHNQMSGARKPIVMPQTHGRAQRA